MAHKRDKTAKGDADGSASVDTENTEPDTGTASVEAATPEPNGAIDKIAEVLAAAMPEPQPEAIAAIREPEKEVTETPPETVVEVKRGRGRPKGSGSKSKINVTQSKPQAIDATAQQKAAAEAQAADIALTAGTATTLTLLAGVMIGGPEFQPVKNQLAGGLTDDQFLNNAYAAYFRAKGISDLPPGVALAGALMVYIAPRFTQPAPRQRVAIIFLKLKGFFGGLFRRKNGSRFNSGNDGKRQDNVSEETSSGV